MIKSGDTVRFINYGAIRYGVVDRVSNGIVWLKNDKWLHIDSVRKEY